MKAQYFALIDLHLKLKSCDEASFSLLLVLLDHSLTVTSNEWICSWQHSHSSAGAGGRSHQIFVTGEVENGVF